MLQQTQVKTVLPYYERFLTRFPDVQDLAEADEQELLALWSGLGYYRRARQMHRAARMIVECHDGTLPRDPVALRALPGIGRYTAGAIASIAFDLREPILDGNVRRVLSRLEGFRADDLTRQDEERHLWQCAARWADGPHPGDLNQGLMELGAMICKPSGPNCDACPVSFGCAALRLDAIDRIPRRLPRPATVHVRVAVAIVRRGNRVLLQRRNGGPLRGEWDLPALELEDGQPAASGMTQFFDEQLQLVVRWVDGLRSVTHGILHRRLTLEVVVGSLSSGRIADHSGLRWSTLDALSSIAISGATTKVLATLSATSGSRSGPAVPAGRPKRSGQVP